MGTVKDLVDVFAVRLSLEESDSGRVLIKGPFGHCTEPTSNGRLYKKPLMEREFKRLKESMKSRRMFGELDHPADGKTSLKRVSHIITGLSINEDGEVVGELEPLPTPMGDILKALAKAGCELGVSSRGRGSVVTRDDGVDEVQEDFVLKTYDVVDNPASKNAFPSVVESEQVDSFLESIDEEHREDVRQAFTDAAARIDTFTLEDIKDESLRLQVSEALGLTESEDDLEETEIAYRIRGGGNFKRKKFKNDAAAIKWLETLFKKEGGSEDVEVRWMAEVDGDESATRDAPAGLDEDIDDASPKNVAEAGTPMDGLRVSAWLKAARMLTSDAGMFKTSAAISKADDVLKSEAQDFDQSAARKLGIRLFREDADDAEVSEEVRPGQYFVLVDVSKPGGKMVSDLIRGAKAADSQAEKARKGGKNIQVIDAKWYGPAADILKATGMSESGDLDEGSIQSIKAITGFVVSVWAELDPATKRKLYQAMLSGADSIADKVGVKASMLKPVIATMKGSIAEGDETDFAVPGDVELAEMFETALPAMREELEVKIRAEMLADPSVAAAKAMVEQIAGMIRPLFPLGMQDDKANRENMALKDALKTRDFDLATTKMEANATTKAAETKMMEAHLITRISGHPKADSIRKMIGPVDRVEGIESLDERIDAAFDAMGTPESHVPDVDAAVESEREQWSGLLEGANADIEDYKRALAKKNAALEKAVSLGEEIEDRREEAASLAESLEISVYAAKRSMLRPDAAKVFNLCESANSREDVDRIMSMNAQRPELRESMDAVVAKTRRATEHKATTGEPARRKQSNSGMFLGEGMMVDLDEAASLAGVSSNNRQ